MNIVKQIDRQLIGDFSAIPLYQNVLEVASSETVEGLMLDEEGWIDFYLYGCQKSEEGSHLTPLMLRYAAILRQ